MLFGLATVGITYVLGWLCFNRWVGAGAGGLVALSGPQLLYEHTVLTEAPFAFLMVALALVLIRASRARCLASDNLLTLS